MPNRLAIVPAYNEEASVASIVRELHEQAPGYDVLVIDDGSTDETALRALNAGAQVISMPFNVGIGGAVQSGYLHAAANGYDVAVQVDGDGQHDPRSLALLEDHLHTHKIDMVVGSRFLDPSGGYSSTRTRQVGIRIFASVLSRVTGQRVTDPTSGLRMCNRRGIELFARDYPHDYPEVEAVLMVHFHHLRSAEVPVTMRERQGGVSSINASRSVYYMFKVLLAVGIGLLRRRPTIEQGDEAPITAEHTI